MKFSESGASSVGKKKSVQAKEEMRKILGDDFWETISDVLPYIGPRVDMYRGEKELIIAAELPGLTSQRDISICLNGFTLILEGQVHREYAMDEDGFLLDERTSGQFKRKIRLPKDCILDELQADYCNGLLMIRVPLIDTDDGIVEKVNINFH